MDLSMNPIVIHVPSSHLYRGMHLRGACEAGARYLVLKEQQDAEVLLLFEDGAYAPADLVHGESGQIALHVAAYTTTRGTSMDARMWMVQTIEERDDELDIRLGYGLP
jgi:hypothetical protein